ncbi:hypothetical protein RhiJN_05266 [Ceratobasidium sp. AG-Ba]|nr:hypothetical protein RhiJN_05266 [Ceratobasidium sp. AG-Ba]
MSDRGLSYSPPPVGTKSKKRKAATTSTTTTTTTKSKRTKTVQQPTKVAQHLLDPFANAKESIRKALASPNSFELPDDEASMRGLVLSISEYAKSLEASVAIAVTSGQPGPAPKPSEQIKTEAEKIAATIKSGIIKQMTWRSTTFEGRTPYVYDGFCSDPRVFGALLKLQGPPMCRTYKFTKDEFSGMIGEITHALRYDTLILTSDVKFEWYESGEFKVKGKYGARPRGGR